MRVRSASVTRVAAGSVAAALAMCSLTLVGTANAALPTGNVAIRPVPTQDPTPVNNTDGSNNPDANGFQNAPFIMTGMTGVKVNDFQVVIPNRWNTGDKLRITLPEGVSFASVPTFTAEGPTTTESLSMNAQTKVVNAGTALRLPAGTAAFAPAGNNLGQRAIDLTFTNDRTQVTDGSDDGARFVLKFTGVSVTTAVAATQGALVATVTGIDQTAGGTAAADFGTVTTTLAYVTNVGVSIGNRPVAPGDSQQTIGPITITEAAPTALVDGTYQLSFTQGPDNAPVAASVDNVNPDGSDFDVKVTGSAVLADNTATSNNNGQVTLPLTGLNADGPLETFVVSNIRVAPGNGGPIHVAITAKPAASTAQLTYNAVQSDSDDTSNLSRVPNARDGIESSTTVGVVPRGLRIGGNDRYQTAAYTAQQVATATTSTYVIASGEELTRGADALAANYLAGGLARRTGQPVPILLTQRGELPDVTANVLRRAVAAGNGDRQITVYIVGGESAVSADVAAAIDLNLIRPNGGFGIVQRVAGSDRYSTASAVATNLGANAVGQFESRYGSGSQNTVFLANGATTFDALSAGPISYRNGFPVVLTQANAVPAATLRAIDSDDVGNVIVLGGPAVVSEAVVTQLAARGLTVRRIAGADRYATNRALNAFVTDARGGSPTAPNGGLGYSAPQTPLLASGISFADALTAGPLAAVGYVTGDTGDAVPNQPLLLTSPLALSAATQQYLSDNRRTVTSVTAVGLGGAVPQAVLIAANQAAS